MNDSEFMRQSQAAVERMREMNQRSKIAENSHHKMPPVPSFVNVNKKDFEPPQNPPPMKTVEPPKPNFQNQKQNSNLGIPLLDNLLKDGDSTLIIGLLLVLMSENTDKMLLFALIYILL